jgi:carbon storage regulator CsrA
MLSLQVKADEYLQIGDDIKVYARYVDGTHVRLSVEAPKSVRILHSALITDKTKAPKKRRADETAH